MGLEAVKEEILSNAKLQVTALMAEARKEANRIIREAEKKIESLKEKKEAEAKRMVDMIKRQDIASAELENKKMLLEAKKQIIDSVFLETGKRLEALDYKKKEVFIKKLLEKAKKDIELNNVYCSKKDAKFLKGSNIEAADMIGGLIAENKEKTVRVDYSFESLLQAVKENELQNVSKILFG